MHNNNLVIFAVESLAAMSSTQQHQQLASRFWSSVRLAAMGEGSRSTASTGSL
jgi:hypothetical protein